MLKTFVFVLGLVCGVLAQAQVRTGYIPYYGEEFYLRLSRGANSDIVKEQVRKVLNSDHLVVPGRYDQLVPSCGSQNCYRHVNIGYNRARVFLMGYFYLINNGSQFGVRDVYCERVYGANEFPGGRRPGPQQIPDDKVVNVEHTWPQSRFGRQYPAEMQKSDLHHLFPTDSQMNSVRSSFPFGEVVRGEKPLKCQTVRFGQSPSGRPVFEPPMNHRGNVARALFYFSTRYGLQIDQEEEFFLRKWNREDPVDENEMLRNNEIQKTQGSRNPFVDYPDLADRISDF